MTNISLDLSGKIDSTIVELYGVINYITSKLGISYVVVGATARDLVLHYGYGTNIKRATTDIDFGMQVESWKLFEKLKRELIANNFNQTKSAHRLIDSIGTQIDIVPFGGLTDKESNIQWPPHGDNKMSVLGFQEAHDHSIKVIIKKEPLIKIPVATPQGLILLKLIAWSDWVGNIRQKDAKDFVYLLETYEKLDNILDKIYEQDGLMDRYEYKVDSASAHVLGIDSARISSEATRKQIHTILKQNLKTGGQNILAEQMSEYDDEYEKNVELLQAFANGFGV